MVGVTDCLRSENSSCTDARSCGHCTRYHSPRGLGKWRQILTTFRPRSQVQHPQNTEENMDSKCRCSISTFSATYEQRKKHSDDRIWPSIQKLESIDHATLFPLLSWSLPLTRPKHTRPPCHRPRLSPHDPPAPAAWSCHPKRPWTCSNPP
jgi:hypothetical protein